MTTTALRRLYASGGSNIRIPTLSFRCAAWADAVHLCQGYVDINAQIEDGSTVTFLASDFAAKLAKKAASGNQSLSFAIDPGESDAVARIDQAVAAGARIYVDYREYIDNDFSAPARAVETLNVTSYQLTPLEDEDAQLSFTASFYDLTNKVWPKRKYTTTFAQGLKHYGS